ncbi:methionyl-tRNA formyltransferase [Xanthomonas sp. JAI131]|nr:methionyl-tRNA formyltransferase [Xanthomonas sp. JAI131]
MPRWRGAAPIQRAIEAGNAETGVCLKQMEAGLDTALGCWRRSPRSASGRPDQLRDRLATVLAEGLGVLHAGLTPLP